MSRVTIGVIGCGVIGPTHVEALANSSAAEVVAVADLIEDRRRQVADKYRVPKTYASGLELLQDASIQAVVLAVPAADRVELGPEALRRHKHLLLEKPVAIDAQAVRNLIAARGKLVAGCCSSRFRFQASTQAATEFLANGAMGPLRLVRARAYNAAGAAPSQAPPDWRLRTDRNGGGILMNWGCYDLDYMLGMLGWSLRPQTVFAQTWTVPPLLRPNVAAGSDAETHGLALIRCDDGCMISFERGEYMTVASDAAWQIIGDKGALRMTMTAWGNKHAILFDKVTADHGVVTSTVWEGQDEGSVIHTEPVRDFASAIREGRQPATTLENALTIQEITDAIYASARKGQGVEISVPGSPSPARARKSRKASGAE